MLWFSADNAPVQSEVPYLLREKMATLSNYARYGIALMREARYAPNNNAPGEYPSHRAVASAMVLSAGRI
jgi:hypothetical protein